MQQSALLLDISDLPPIESLDAEDIQQLTACIELCRSNDRPDLAAPYAMLLCEYYNHYNETENSLWFDAVATDDLFMVKALVTADFDINTIAYISGEWGDEWHGTAIHAAIENNSHQCLDYLLQQPDINLNLVGCTSHDTEQKNAYEDNNKYTIPLLALYRSSYRNRLDDFQLDVEIKWGRGNCFNPLLNAVYDLDDDLMTWLLTRKANPNAHLFFNGMQQETPFGNLASWYFHDPDDVKLQLLLTMAHFGASPMAQCDDGHSVIYKALKTQNESLISVFDLYDIQELFEEYANEVLVTPKNEELIDQYSKLKKQIAQLTVFYEHAELNHTPLSRRTDDYHCPSLKISILNEMRIAGSFIPANWITELAIIQQDDEIGLYIEQQEAQIAAITIMLPAEVSYLSYPFTSSIAMGLHFIQCPPSWWLEVERYLHRYHITLIDPQFFDISRDQLEQGYC